MIRQSWWGHRAPKPTWLYIVGVSPAGLPPMPAPVADPGGRVENMCHREREITPSALALWLVELARRASPRRRRNALEVPVTAAETVQLSTLDLDRGAK